VRTNRQTDRQTDATELYTHTGGYAGVDNDSLKVMTAYKCYYYD